MECALCCCSWLPLRGGRQRDRHSSTKHQSSAGGAQQRAMPQPPNEFFEPSRVTIEVPAHLSPEIFYVLHYLKSVCRTSGSFGV